MYFFSDEYIRFVSDLRKYINTPIKIISYKESRYKNELEHYGGENLSCPIGVLGNVECVFLHYKTDKEAVNKWNKRIKRINWDRLYIKMSEQNFCTPDHIIAFEKLPLKNKFVFVTKNYGIKSQVIFGDYFGQDRIQDDTTNFRRYVDIISWINEKPFKLRQPHF